MSPLRSSAGPAVCTNGTLELGGDDLRERGLAEAGRAGEQDVVERLAARAARPRSRRRAAPSAPPGRRSPRAGAGAASVERRPRRGRRASGCGRRRACGCRRSPARRLQRVGDQVLGASRRARRRAAPRPPGREKPSPTRPSRGEQPRVVAAARPRSGRPPGAAPTFSRSSTMIRSAVRLPMPGTAWRRAASPAATAASSSRGGPPERTASATFGPDGLHADAAAGRGRAPPRWRSRRAQRVVAHDEVRVQRGRLARGGDVAERLGGDGEAVADAAAVTTTTWSGRRTATSPRTSAIIRAWPASVAWQRAPHGAGWRGRWRPRARRRRGRAAAARAARAASGPSAAPGPWRRGRSRRPRP